MSRFSSFSSLVELAQHRAAHNTSGHGYSFLNEDGSREHLSYRELDAQARRIACRLRDIGKPGDRAILFFNPGLDYVCAFFGCLYAGMIAVPSYPPKFNRNQDKIIRLLADCGAKLVLCDSQILAAITPHVQADPFFADIAFIDTGLQDELTATDWRTPSSEPQSLAFLQYTSGSTANPKGVMVTHGNLLANLQVIADGFGESAESRGVIWLPPYHDMGLIGGILQPLFSDFPVTLMSPFSFLQKPLRWLQAIARDGATTSGGPNFAYDLCVERVTPAERDALDLSSWQVAFNGAEPVSKSTMDRFAAYFAAAGFRRSAFYPCYGLAESTLFVTGATKGSISPHCHVDPAALRHGRFVPTPDGSGSCLASSGKTVGESSLFIVSEQNGKICPEGEIGEIWVSGPSVAAGYWNQAELSQASFRAGPVNGQFCLRTGDLGCLHQGELYVTGRLKDLIIIRGRNHYPHDIESSAEDAHPALIRHASAAFTVERAGEEKLVLAFEMKRGSGSPSAPELFELLSRELLARHEIELAGIIILKPMGLPKTSSGKIQRKLCRQKYLDGSLDELSAYFAEDARQPDSPANPSPVLALPDPREDTDGFLARLAAELLKISPAELDWLKPLENYSFDSLRLVNFTHRIETETGLALPLSDLLGGACLSDIKTQIRAQIERLGTAGAGPIGLRESAPRSGPHALSRNQQTLWFMEKISGSQGVYKLCHCLRLSPETRLDTLVDAINTVVESTPEMRTTFNVSQGITQQIVNSFHRFYIAIDHTFISDESQLEAHLETLISEPFKLEGGALYQFRIIKTATNVSYLFFAIHHIISDFWSLSIFARKLGEAYTALCQGNPVIKPVSDYHSYADFVQWQESRMQDGSQSLQYWRGALSGELPVLNLLSDFPRPAVQSYRGAAIDRTLGSPCAQALRQLGARSGASPFMVLLACYQVLLHKYSGQNDLLTGTLAAGRPDSRFAQVMGYFINPLALRSQTADNPSFSDFLLRTKHSVVQGLAHQDYPFSRLVEELRPSRDPSRPPLFQTMFVYQSSADPGLADLAGFAINRNNGPLRVGSLSVELVPIRQRTVQYELSLVAADQPDGIGLSFQFNTDLYRPQTIERLAGHFANLVKHLVTHPELPLSEASLLDPIERDQVLRGLNATGRPLPEEPLHQAFERHAAASPERIAVVCEGLTLDYGTLNAQANRLAHELIARGVGRGHPVVICLERSPRLVVALLAVLKAGAYYVPLDPTHPKERLGLIIEDLAEAGKAPVAITQSTLQHIFEGGKAIPFCLEPGASALEDRAEPNPALPIGPGELAYTIYTSGSTGKPKGVEISHGAVVNFLLSMRESPGFAAEDRLLSVTTVSFDIAGLEIHLPLACGACVVLAREHAALNGHALVELLRDQRISVMQATPSVWRLMIAAGWQGSPGLRVLCGGEAFPPELAEQLLGRAAEVWNMYGPTETTIWSTVFRIREPMKTIPVGRPIANTKVYILDPFLKPVPQGVAGELCIGGAGVARGYFNRPELSAEKFLPDPFTATPGERIYRTGDLARIQSDGSIEFLGRLDHQVKIRGFRIEIGEIEAALKAHPSVQDALVVAMESPTGGKQLVAYLTAKSRPGPSTSLLHGFLRRSLPDYMVPSFFMVLDAFPQTPNGKIDRKALPAPSGERPELANAYVAPRSGTEALLAQAWRDALKLDRIGAHDNFFELGGNSLLMVQVHQRIAESFPDRSLGVVELFQYPTIASLSGYLSGDHAEAQASLLQQAEQIETRKSRSAALESRRGQQKTNRLDF